MSAPYRTALIGVASGLAIFALALAGGFLVGHAPEADTIAVRLEPPTDLPTDTLHSGTVSTQDAGALEIATASGPQRFDLAPDTPIEDMIPLGEEPDVAEGVPVNVGGERTNNGYVLTGVVVVEGAP